tara:strand:+ start:54083 stop:54997 length:915 start_codon:yes stop_codon:yes gene_type:complete
LKSFELNKNLLKIISLFLSVTLWFYVLNSEPLEVERKMSLVLLPPPGLALNVEVPKEIRVKIKGNRTFVQDLMKSNEKLFIDLKDHPYGQETFAVTFSPDMIPVPFGIEVLEIEPQQVVLSLEKQIKKYVPVKAKIVGDLINDLRLTKRKIEPKQFLISGPRSILKTIGLIETLPIDLSVLEGSGKIQTPIEILDSRVVIEDFIEPVFEYTIRPNKANFTVKNVKIHFLSASGHIESKDQFAALDVLIPQGDKAPSLKASEVKVIAEVPEGSNGKVRVRLRAELPNHIHLLQIHPEYINVSVNK